MCDGEADGDSTETKTHFSIDVVSSKSGFNALESTWKTLQDWPNARD